MFSWMKSLVQRGQRFKAASLETVVLSEAGCSRKVNEDAVRVYLPSEQDRARKGVLLVIADGGEASSHMAVESVGAVYYGERRSPREALRNCFRIANRRIRQSARMSTACTALLLMSDHAWIANIGNTRCYLVRNGKIRPLTTDNSGALGKSPEAEFSVNETPLGCEIEDRFLLCSDGLYDLVDSNEILELTTSNEPAAACKELVKLAKDRGGFDNITVAIAYLAAKNSTTGRPIPLTKETPAEAAALEMETAP